MSGITKKSFACTLRNQINPFSGQIDLIVFLLNREEQVLIDEFHFLALALAMYTPSVFCSSDFIPSCDKNLISGFDFGRPRYARSSFTPPSSAFPPRSASSRR
jgi:hypothetical protein